MLLSSGVRLGAPLCHWRRAASDPGQKGCFPTEGWR